VTTGKLRQVTGQREFLYAGVFTPDGKTLATGSNQGIVLWDVATAKQRSRLGRQRVGLAGLTFSSDGQLLASLGEGTIHLWEVATGKERPVPAEGHQGGVEAVVFLPDGKTRVSAGRDCTLRLWETATGRPVRHHRVPAGTPDTHGWFAPDGSTLAWRDGKRVSQMNVGAGKPLHSVEFPEAVYFFAVSPDGKLLAAYGRDRTLRIVDRATGKVVREFGRYPELVSRLAFAPDGRTLAVAVEDDTIRLEDTTTGEQREMLRFPTMPTAFVFSPEGKTLTVALADNSLVLVEVASGKERLALGMAERAGQLAYSPDGKLLAVGSEAGAIQLWELATGKEVCRVGGAPGRRLVPGLRGGRPPPGIGGP
jgi:WD40 repeat protein